MGDPKGSSFVGSWEITRNAPFGSSKSYDPRTELTGYMTIYPTGVAKLRMQRGHAQMEAVGRYVQYGDTVKLTGLKPVGDDNGAFPKDVNLELSWKDSNVVSVAVDRKETLDMQRTDPDPFIEP